MINLKKIHSGLEFIADANEEICRPVKNIIVGLSQVGDDKDFALRLCLDESISNAIKHGNKYSGKIKVCFTEDKNYVQVRVEDSGNGFKLADVPDCRSDENLEKPSGRGIKLMMAYADKLEYNEKGNCVTFGFYKCETEEKKE